MGWFPGVFFSVVFSVGCSGLAAGCPLTYNVVDFLGRLPLNVVPFSLLVVWLFFGFIPVSCVSFKVGRLIPFYAALLEKKTLTTGTLIAAQLLYIVASRWERVCDERVKRKKRARERDLEVTGVGWLVRTETVPLLLFDLRSSDLVSIWKDIESLIWFKSQNGYHGWLPNEE
ncbi:hypothetical protein NE237_026148 [Protea cynaroides]|uniref:Uncharacterized protein n=1 Tax=Protea cynaroides TaxID=273540 RepID=A0A9Q0H7L3_9MAGN|nr:hypothetical protein NE237_026148 [Protea cynaroides]